MCVHMPAVVTSAAGRLSQLLWEWHMLTADQSYRGFELAVCSSLIRHW